MKIGYSKLLREMLTNADSFSFVVRDGMGLNESGKKIIEDLKSHLIEATRSSEWPGTKLINHTALVSKYRLNEESIKSLSRVKGLFDWMQPDLPEDLTFYKNDKPIFVSIAHEKDCWYVE